MVHKSQEVDQNTGITAQNEYANTDPDTDLAAALRIDDEQERAKAVEKFIESASHDFRFPDDVLPKLLALNPTYGTRSRVLQAVVPRLSPEQIKQALPDITHQSNEKVWVEDLAQLVPWLPASSLEQALEIAEKIDYTAARWRALVVVAPYLPLDLQRRAVASAARLSSSSDRVSAIAGILQNAPRAASDEVLEQLVTWAREDEREDSRARYLSEAASALARCGRTKAAQALTEEAIRLLDAIPSDKAKFERIFALKADGDVRSATGDHASAAMAYEQAIKLAEDSGQTHLVSSIYLSLGLSLQAMGDLKGSIEPLTQAAESGNAYTEVQARRRLRRAYKQLGLDANAAAEADRIRELGQDLGADAIEFDLSRTLKPDLPSKKDELGFEPLGNALVDMLNDNKTQLPLAIALTAPWGGGKSSLMRQVEQRLRRTSDRSPSVGADVRRWCTVRFDAWKFHQSEQIWASLAKEIYKQAQLGLNPLQRIWFRLRLEWTRGQLPRELMWAVLVICGCALAGALLNFFDMGLNADAAKGAITGVVGSLALFLGRYGKDLTNPFRRAIDRHQARQQVYRSVLGVMAEAENDIDALTRTLTKSPSSALSVFVDDLDRCSPSHIVAVVETINQIFNNNDKRHCAFILGIDSDVITASLEYEYAGMVKCLSDRNRALAERFGESFLEKIVQLTVVIPKPDLQGLTRLLGSMTGNTQPQDHRQRRIEIDEKAVQDAVELFESEPLKDPIEVEQRRVEVEQGFPDRKPAVIREAARRVRSRLLNTDSNDVARVEFKLLRYLPRNPRTLKRFDNAFRLQLLVANNTPGCELDFRYEEIEAIGRWVALHFGWPELANSLKLDPQLLQDLERVANNEEATNTAALQGWDKDKGLMAILGTDQNGVKISQLPFDTFVNIR